MENKNVLLIYNTICDPFEQESVNLSESWLITSDRSCFLHATAVVFHLPTLNIDLYTLAKPAGQVWIAWSRECEQIFLWIDDPAFSSLFDLTMGYRKTDDVLYPYYKYKYPVLLQKNWNFEKRENKICMFISSPLNNSKRQEYLSELMQYTRIDSYGKLFNNQKMDIDNGRNSKLELYTHYKYVIAFENAISDDYVTEKFYDPLLSGAVPIYLGASNIRDYIPGNNCFVDASAYLTPKALADFINASYQDEEVYASFQEWRKQGVLVDFVQKTEKQADNPFVRICKKVEEYKHTEEQLKEQKLQLGNIYLCAFADSRYQRSVQRLLIQADSLGVFKDGYIYDESDLPSSFVSDFKLYLDSSVRGYGYWVWKPYIILECLERIDEGDVLLYLDAGCHLNKKGQKYFFDYWKEVKNNDSGFLVSTLGVKQIESKWTKGDLLDYFGLRNNSTITNMPQYQASIIFVRKNNDTVSVIKKWLKVYYDDFHLADDSFSISANMEGFCEHRHDQSILSILLKIHGTSLIPLSSVYSNHWDLLKKEYPILQKRDLQ